MADYSTELSQSSTTLYLQPADGFQRSTQFGETYADLHQFTGSMRVTGSSHHFTGSMYISGTLYANRYQVNIIDTTSGSTIFGNSSGDTHQLTGSVYFGGVTGSAGVLTTGQLTASQGLMVVDDRKLYFGTNKDVSLEYDEDGTNELRFAGAAALFEQAVFFDANVTLGNASTDVVSVLSQVTASQGLLVKDDKKLYFGAGEDASIEYDEDGRNRLIISGSPAGIEITGSTYFGANTTVTGDVSGSARGIFVTGLTTAGPLNVSGSTIFGNAAADKHQFTGSVYFGGVTGSAGVLTTSQLTASDGLLVANARRLKIGVGNYLVSDGSAVTWSGLYTTFDNSDVGWHHFLSDVSGSKRGIFVESLTTAGPLNVTGTITAPGIASGSRGGDKSYVVLNTSNQLVLDEAVATSLTQANQGNNRIITSVDATNINAEANLLFNGSTLAVTGDVSGSARGIFVDGLTTAGPLNVTGTITAPGIASGSRGGDKSYVVLNTSNQLVLDELGAAGVTQANQGNNRIITSVDATNINAEANLSFDGSTLAVTGDVSGSARGIFVTGLTTAGPLSVSGSTILGNAAADKHQFTGSVYFGGVTGSAGVLTTSQLTASQGLMVVDDRKLYFGNNRDVSLEYDEDGTNHFRIVGYNTTIDNSSGGTLNVVAGTSTFTGDVSGSARGIFVDGLTTAGPLNVSGSTIFGNTSADKHQFTGSVSISGTLTANEYRVQTIDTSAGSTIFGNSAQDTHQFTGSVYFNNSVFPGSDNTVDLGSASRRWANIYTGDLHLKNERGNWSIIEEEDYLCVRNNITGKRFKMMLQEIED